MLNIRYLHALAACGVLAACAPAEPEYVTFGGETMGTTYAVAVAGCPPSICGEELETAIAALLSQLESQMSHYDSGSELRAFNESSSTDWFDVPVQLADVVGQALSISAFTSGTFDITVAPAVDAWGFGAPDTPAVAPDPQSLAGLTAHSGWTLLEARIEPPGLRKADPELRIDLSAIAKGYAADQVAYLLEMTGLEHFVVEIGGELRVAGIRADGLPWRVGIERPDSKLDISHIVVPGDNGVATSGNYRNFRVIEATTYGHTIDPATGKPASTDLLAVTVIAPAASAADALATALMVMGADSAAEFAERNELAAMFSRADAEGVRVSYSSEFKKYLEN